MAEVIPIQVKITPENVEQTKRKIIRATEQIEDQAERTGKKISQSVGGGFQGALQKMGQGMRGFVRIAKGVGLVALLLAIGDAMVRIVQSIPRVISLFDQLSANLRVVTNTANEANQAFAILVRLAEQTSTPIEEMVGGFIRLRTLGLDPTNDTMISFAATARALGRSLDQFVEAVADAITGEFERLKEFGIRTRREGDQVQFTFQGITETVALNAQAIQGYLEEIGRTRFGDIFEQQANTIRTAIATLRVQFQLLIQDAFGRTASEVFTGFLNSLSNIVKWVRINFVPRLKIAFLSIQEFVAQTWETISSIVTLNFEGLNDRLIGIMEDYAGRRAAIWQMARDEALDIRNIPGAVDVPGAGGGANQALQTAQENYLISWRNTEETSAKERAGIRASYYELLIQRDEEYAREVQTVLNTATSSWQRGLENFISTGKISFKGLIDGMISDLARLGVNRVFQALIGGTTPGGGATGLTRIITGFFGNAKGNIVKRYAKGGLIDKPTIFPARRGMALAGEAGTEAIMPLQRDRRGNLGVSGQTAGTVNNYYINAIDTQSFAEAARRSGAIPGLVAEDIGNNGVSRQAVLNAR